jgi:hypothetical protein
LEMYERSRPLSATRSTWAQRRLWRSWATRTPSRLAMVPVLGLVCDGVRLSGKGRETEGGAGRRNDRGMEGRAGFALPGFLSDLFTGPLPGCVAGRGCFLVPIPSECVTGWQSCVPDSPHRTLTVNFVKPWLYFIRPYGNTLLSARALTNLFLTKPQPRTTNIHQNKGEYMPQTNLRSNHRRNQRHGDERENSDTRTHRRPGVDGIRRNWQEGRSSGCTVPTADTCMLRQPSNMSRRRRSILPHRLRKNLSCKSGYSRLQLGLQPLNLLPRRGSAQC